MALTYRCRSQHIKQVAIALTKSRLKDRTRIPGPMEYDLPDILGRSHITHSVISPRLDPAPGKDKMPGPAEHLPDLKVRMKRPPAFSILPRCHDKYDSDTMWTPPNMYYPPVKGKKPPAFSLIGKLPAVKENSLPGPSDYDAKFHYVRQTVPKFTIRGKLDHSDQKLHPTPAPNEYCSKKFNMKYPTTQVGRSFGIWHSPFLGSFPTYTKSDDLYAKGPN